MQAVSLSTWNALGHPQCLFTMFPGFLLILGQRWLTRPYIANIFKQFCVLQKMLWVLKANFWVTWALLEVFTLHTVFTLPTEQGGSTSEWIPSPIRVFHLGSSETQWRRKKIAGMWEKCRRIQTEILWQVFILHLRNFPKDSDIKICSKGETQPSGGGLNSVNTPNPEKKKQILIF